jgi:CubicO group peptidase (beta-lactamase class C family)
MAKFGYLYLQRGRWQGIQIIPTDFFAESTHRQSAGGPPVDCPYGYLWWIPEPYPAFFASGTGGQRIHVIPELDLVVAFTTRQLQNSAYRMLDRFILPAILH